MIDKQRMSDFLSLNKNSTVPKSLNTYDCACISVCEVYFYYKKVIEIDEINNHTVNHLPNKYINGKYDIKINQTVAKVDPKYFRPTEVDLLIGDATKAKTKLGWKLKYDLPALVKEMVASDLELFKKEKFLKENGYKIAKEGE